MELKIWATLQEFSIPVFEIYSGETKVRISLNTR